jgi:hypothetical protein
MEMADHADKKIGMLSGGQRQRVFIARALVAQPKLLLLDEPTASIDTKGQADFYRFLKELNQDITVLVVSHDLLVVSRYVKSVACVNKKLHYHDQAEITGEMLETMYACTVEEVCPVELVAHGLPHRVLMDHEAIAMIEALQFEFMRNALAAGLLASVICGIMGTLVVVNRIVFLSGGIAHAAYGGIGLAFYFKWSYLPSAIGFSVFAAMVMAAISHTVKHRADTIIGVIWALGMAVGIILIDLTPGYNVDLMSYLFGSILTVPRSDLITMAAVGMIMTGPGCLLLPGFVGHVLR